MCVVYIIFQAGLTAVHSAIVNNISQEMNGRYLSLQKQHQEFAAHLNNQIASLEQQLNQLMHGLCFFFREIVNI